MMKFWIFLWFFLWLLQPAGYGYAQEVQLPGDSLPVALSNTISLYREKIKDDSFLAQGREYVGYNNRIEGHPFFQSDSFYIGNLLYQGLFYTDVPLMYDLLRGEVVVQQYGSSLKLKLFKEQVQSFALQGHHFTRVNGVDAKGTPMIAGFYDLLYRGDIQVLVKREKEIVEEIKGSLVRRRFVQENQVYIGKDDKYFPVKKKGAVLKVLKDQKKEIRRFLKREKIRFKRDPEYAIVKMVEFYNQAQE